jgi:hypothetical protein
MPAYARSQIVPPDEVGVYHCMARCVRRAFLCGVDPLINHDYDYRRSETGTRTVSRLRLLWRARQGYLGAMVGGRRRGCRIPVF